MTARVPLSRPVLRTIIALGVSQIIGWGSTYYLLTIFAGPIGASLGMSPGVTAIGMTVLMLLTAIAGPFAGNLMDVHGAGPVMAAGSMLAAIGLAFLSFADGLFTYFAAWVVIGTSCPMILYSGAFTALTQVAPEQARRAITLLTLPGGLASTVFWPLSAWLLTKTDWRTICLLYAGLNLVICLPLHLFAIPKGGSKRVAPDESRSAVPGLAQPLRRKAVLLLSLMLAMNSVITVGTLNQFTTLLAALDHSSQIAVTAGVLFGISQVSARIVEMIAGGHYDPLKGTLFITLGYTAAFVMLGLFSPLPLAALAFAIMFGAANGLFTINRGALVLSLFGSEGYGHMTGKVAVAQNIVGAAAPIVLASVIGAWGGSAALLFAIVASLGSAVAMFALFRHATASKQVRSPLP